MIARFNKDEKRSAGITAMIVVLLTAVFFFVGLTLEIPLPKGELEISFGTSNDGMGEVQPEEFTSKNEQVEQQEVVESQASESAASETMTANDNIVEAPIQEEKQPEVSDDNPKESAEETETKTDAETDMLNDLYPSASSSQDSEGETGKSGDQGDPEGGDNTNHAAGFWDGDSYYAAGPGRGKGFTPGKRETDCREKGKVGVIIYVNRDGKIIGEPRFTSEGTTNPAPCLVEKAINWAKGITYEANPSAPVQQKILRICNFDYKE